MATGIEQQLPLDNTLFMPQMTVQAMRDSRYRHTANAIAELIDNSIDARARSVDLLVRETERMVNTRRRRRISQIAVFDNGHGMSSETLVQALRFGGHQQSQSINRIGKYGMGLPTSSVSQCRRVDVWTWQDDIEQALHSYIDVDMVEAGEQLAVPHPDTAPIPDEWMRMVSAETLDRSRGTLVVWSNPDRITVQAETIFRQVEEEIGRIYRHYINDNELAIRMASIREGELQPHPDRTVRPNDPLYLMANSSTPEPWGQEPMFESRPPAAYAITVDGRQETVEVNYSIAKPAALGEYRGDLPGNRDYGRHALKNMGVSVVRENREILVENYFVREGGGNAIPQNRWWGCEIRFNSGADSLFGIDHNKQMVATLSRAFKDLYEGMDERANPETVIQEIDAEDEPIYRIASDIRGTIRNMMGEIDQRFAQRQPRPRPENPDGKQVTIEETAIEALTDATRQRLESQEEPQTSTDIERQQLGEEERIEAITQELMEEGQPQEQAEQIAAITVQRDRWYTITPSQVDGYRMFSVKGAGGVLNVRLNINNNIFELISQIDREAEENENEVARNAAIVIRAMILSWARMEDGTEDRDRRMELQGLSERWGRAVHHVLADLGNPPTADTE